MLASLDRSAALIDGRSNMRSASESAEMVFYGFCRQDILKHFLATYPVSDLAGEQKLVGLVSFLALTTYARLPKRLTVLGDTPFGDTLEFQEPGANGFQTASVMRLKRTSAFGPILPALGRYDHILFVTMASVSSAAYSRTAAAIAARAQRFTVIGHKDIHVPSPGDGINRYDIAPRLGLCVYTGDRT